MCIPATMTPMRTLQTEGRLIFLLGVAQVTQRKAAKVVYNHLAEALQHCDAFTFPAKTPAQNPAPGFFTERCAEDKKKPRAMWGAGPIAKGWWFSLGGQPQSTFEILKRGDSEAFAPTVNATTRAHQYGRSSK